MRASLDVATASGIRTLRANAWANVGLVRSLRGEAPLAAEAYSRASSFDPSDCRWSVSAFLTALDSGQCALAALAAERVDAYSMPGDWLVEEILRGHRERIAHGQYRPADSWGDLVHELRAHMGPSTEYITHELLEA